MDPAPRRWATMPASAALRRQIAESSTIEEARLPPSGWLRVAESASTVLFVAPGDARTPWLQVEFRIDPVQGVRKATVGQCHMRPLAAPGTTLADWWLDPSVEAPRPGDTSILALIEEAACASGGAPGAHPAAGGRLRERPDRRYVRDPALPGTQSCIGNRPFSVVINLTQPIGGRLLLDGSVFPPRDARMAPQ